ncbi:MAG: ATP-binding protein [Actinomycetota bacterium]|nr:ATP-binding protein [Actinomycetota bacterium]
MKTPVLRKIHLTAFKSFSGSTLPVDPVTVLTGRNSSGKSNALDGIEVLSRLASGEELTDALDGRRREGGPVRGGSRGCAPHGTAEFELGCTVLAEGDTYGLDVIIQVEPELRILQERLQGPAPALASGLVEQRWLLYTREPTENSAALLAEIHNGKRGVNPLTPFRDTRLLTSQLPLRVVPQNEADAAVIRGAQAVTAALRGAFHLDPVPHLMREYVSERDTELRRTGENISAAIARLRRDDEAAFDRLLQLVQQIAEERIHGIVVTRSELGDVMLALEEGLPQNLELTPAREMSDGLLRFVAVATALLTPNRGLDIDPGLTVEDGARGILLVIEELENGLHPSQAGRVLQLIKEASSDLAKRVMVTTHSPALLNAMTGKLNKSIIVCYRDTESGLSRLSRLTELPGYAEAMASGRLGDAVTQGQLIRPEHPEGDFSQFNQLLGIDG